MPIAAQCPSCGGPLSETSVVALAPVCARCGTVIVETGGTLGLTSAYGVNDPTITRRRVEADLAVFQDYRNKYVGMLEACKEQLKWGVERYANLPSQPVLLTLVEVPRLLPLLWQSFYLGLGVFFGLGCLLGTLEGIVHLFVGRDSTADAIMRIIWLLATVAPAAVLLPPYFKAKAANGNRPAQNARRQKEYKKAYAETLKAAEPVKAAQDHRLRVQIRELDGLIKTVTQKAEEISGLLRTH